MATQEQSNKTTDICLCCKSAPVFTADGWFLQSHFCIGCLTTKSKGELIADAHKAYATRDRYVSSSRPSAEGLVPIRESRTPTISCGYCGFTLPSHGLDLAGDPDWQCPRCRDQFAMVALGNQLTWTSSMTKELADRCYFIADAMMEARKAKESVLAPVGRDPDFPFMDEGPKDAETVRKIVRFNVAREREACAQIADDWDRSDAPKNFAFEIAEEIRQRDLAASADKAQQDPAVTQSASDAATSTRNRVCFYASDMEGLRATLIVEHHANGSSSSVKLLDSELDELVTIPRLSATSGDKVGQE